MTYDFEVNPALIGCFPGVDGIEVISPYDGYRYPVAFGTIQKALNAAKGREHTTILVRAGTYIESCEIDGGKVELWGE